ncbi:MAG: PhnD/SsuA/transferrin family substrate-binding protein [Acidimicrobiales bacterium]|jgi:phosphonate transport system substrate-binding protein
MGSGDEDYLLGAVAYDPKVVTIWEGFREFFKARDFPFDFVLYSNYERQVEDLLNGRIHAAWNSPLAWVRARRLAQANDGSVRALVMRDTDRDLSSVVVVREDGAIRTPSDLVGKRVATGAIDSPQATLLPLDAFRDLGMNPGKDFEVVHFDVGVGLHGDHIGGEREAARALARGEVEAACMVDANHLMFSREGTLLPGSTRILVQTNPYDHCNMTVVDTAPTTVTDRFVDLLLEMDYGDAALRPLLDLEGLKQWLPGRVSGYDNLERAVDHGRFYSDQGEVTADGYDY